MFHFRKTRRNPGSEADRPRPDAEVLSMQHALDVERIVALRELRNGPSAQPTGGINTVVAPPGDW